MKTFEIALCGGDRVDEQAAKSDFAILHLSRAEVEGGLVGDAVDRMMAFSESAALSRKYANGVALVVGGYERDPRPLSHIPEVCAFFRAFVKEWPYIFHFLEKAGDSIGVAIGLLVDLDRAFQSAGRVGSYVRDYGQFQRVLLQMFEGMNSHYEHFGYTEDENRSMSESVLDAVQRAFGVP